MLKQINFFKLLKIIIHGKSSWRLLIGAILSIGFSQSVILSTVGLMDGFDFALKRGLKNTTGDFKITTSKGFFEFDQNIKAVLEKNKFVQFSPVVQSEGYFIAENGSKGVLIKGIDFQSFSQVTGLEIKLDGDESIAIGKELAEDLKIKIGDEIAISFAKGSKELKGAPRIETFVVSSLVSHGIYEKDLRFVYIQNLKLAEILGSNNKVNVLFLNSPNKSEKMDDLVQLGYKLEDELGYSFKVRPYWSEFSGILKAVQVEKLSLGFILQIIVIVSIFNIAAFIIFITERKSQDFFLLRSLGLGQKALFKFWTSITVFIWFFGCILAILFTEFFSWAINNLELIKGLRSIYFVERIDLILSMKEYIFVFGLTYIWMLLISLFGIFKFSRKSVLVGMRQEFV